MLHILFSILISLGTFSSVNVTKVERVKKVDADKQEIIFSTIGEEPTGW